MSGRNRRQRRGEFVFQLLDLLCQLIFLCSVGRVLGQLLHASDFVFAFFRRGLPRLLFGGRREDKVVLLGRGEVCLQAVVVLLRDRLQFVIVAASTPDGQAENRRADDVGPLGEHFVAAERDVGIPRVAPHWAKPMKDRCGQALVTLRLDLIPRDLLDKEPIKWLVLVEGIDDVIPIPPRSGNMPVVLKPLCLREPHHIEPQLRRLLPKVPTRQQPIDNLLVSVRRFVADERFDLFRRRRQPDQIKRHTANECTLAGSR